jgi:hypothetical protein
VFAALAGLGGCERAAPFDPDRRAAAILDECGPDSSCARERWRRDPRDWNLGLRAEVAGREPATPLMVETLREIVTPDLLGTPCAPARAAAAPTVVYFETSLRRKTSGVPPLALFRWERFEDALGGHRRVVAAAADARGDERALWNGILGAAALDRACIRFVGERDRCQPRG